MFQGNMLVGRSSRKKCFFIQQAFIESIFYAINYAGDVGGEIDMSLNYYIKWSP